MDWLLLQLADSAFPTGGFVHSGGLEAAARLGLVAGVGPWLERSLRHAGRAQLPLVGAGWDAGGLDAADALAEAWIRDPAANRASRGQGQAWVGTAAAAFPSPALAALKRRLRAGELHGHLAPLCGRVLAELGQARRRAQELFLFLHLRAGISTAVRLGLAGPLEAQRLQAALAGALAATLAACGALGTDDLAATAPLCDLAQGHHDRLETRIFAT
jgi:urease accessory protein